MNLKYMRTVFMVLGLVFTTSAIAHSSMVTSPQDGAMMENSPDSIMVQFDKISKILKFSIENSKGDEIEFTPPSGKGFTNMYEAVVNNLPSGMYMVNWSAIGKDGHPVKNNFSFTVK